MRRGRNCVHSCAGWERGQQRTEHGERTRQERGKSAARVREEGKCACVARVWRVRGETQFRTQRKEGLGLCVGWVGIECSYRDIGATASRLRFSESNA